MTMIETDWREILNYSQKELKQADKEKLCENLSWMEADDIELNFSDLKTLFRLSQDILKFKSEQVNTLLGQVETLKRRYGKAKEKIISMDSPAKESDFLETISHQEEVIKANKEILEQLYSEIADLEKRKSKVLVKGQDADINSDSSRDALSQMDALAKLENEVSQKNRHIRKLLSDVKVLEEENNELKEKLAIFKEKLKESTQIIENLTENLFALNSECGQLKSTLGKSEEEKAHLKLCAENLTKELRTEIHQTKENIQQDNITQKIKYLKETIQRQKNELKKLSSENIGQKEEIAQLKNNTSYLNQHRDHELKIKELQDKLAEASRRMLETAEVVNDLKIENNNLKKSNAPQKNNSEPKTQINKKEISIIQNYEKTITNLTCLLHGAEEMLSLREKQLTEVAAQLQVLKTNDGIKSLIVDLNNKKIQMKSKDEGIKSLVEEVNKLHQTLNDLQLENESMRQRLKIPKNKKIEATGILKDYYDMKQTHFKVARKIEDNEKKLLTIEVESRIKDEKIAKLTNCLQSLGYSEKIDAILNNDCDILLNVEDSFDKEATVGAEKPAIDFHDKNDYKSILEENEGLRLSLTEILSCLKDNSTTSSGILKLECPSLDSVLQSMEARKTAGWFAPHMKTIVELRSAMGGRDALLTALHQSRKETYEVMTQLSEETKKTLHLEKELKELQTQVKSKEDNNDESCSFSFSDGEFGSWIQTFDYNNVDILDTGQLREIVTKGDIIYEKHIKLCLKYFKDKFNSLYDKLTKLSISIVDERNKWLVQEENYKAEIAKLRLKIEQDNHYDEDISEPSPGLIDFKEKSNTSSNLAAQINFLQENYKYVKALNDNLKNENMDCKNEALFVASDYEKKIQQLMMSLTNLTDKLHSSIPIDLFWKQNNILNEYILKYRTYVESNVSSHINTTNLLSRLNENKTDIMNNFKNYLQGQSKLNDSHLSNLEISIVQKQVVVLTGELDVKEKEIQKLKTSLFDLQKSQNELINKLSLTIPREEVIFMKDNLKQLTDENKAVKDRCTDLMCKLDVASTQLQAFSQRELSVETEIDLLRHQILDLQSSQNKVSVSRLSTELLIAHLQATETFQRMESLKLALNKERQTRLDTEDMLQKQQKIFDIYLNRNNNKFRNVFEVMEILRQQYQGIIPLICLESYSNKLDEMISKNNEINQKLNEIDNDRNNLMIKHAVFDQILNYSKTKCLEEQHDCPHQIRLNMSEKMKQIETKHYVKKIDTIEQSRKMLIQQYHNLEKSFLFVNQAYKKTQKRLSHYSDGSVNVEDLQSDTDSNKGNETYTLSQENQIKASAPQKAIIERERSIKTHTVFTQTDVSVDKRMNKETQSEEDRSIKDLQKHLDLLRKDKDLQDQKFNEILLSCHKQTEHIHQLNRTNIELTSENVELKRKVENLIDLSKQKDNLNEILNNTNETLKKEMIDLKNKQNIQTRRDNETSEEAKSLLLTIKKTEVDKNFVIDEYKKLLNDEREEFAKSIHEYQTKIATLQSQLDKAGSNIDASTSEEVNSKTHEKLITKITEYEDKCFKLKHDLETCESDLQASRSELDRWKNLASERLTKMEQLSTQLKERHNQEVESYKAENEHWLVQLNETQREHADLRSRLTEQKALHIKQLNEKDAHIEHLRSIINNLKTQIMNMQTMLTINDPSFDLSAIVEVEEGSDAISHQDSDRLEIKFESTGDLNDFTDDIGKFPSSSTAIWQEPLIERLRREKQQISKQNAILRKQIKALAGRERRARLDAQNLKNQVFRISTSGHKVPSVESAALQNKIASLQAQLTSARRDAHSTVALWDKWKRAQQSSEHWQAKYEEKCQEVMKLESSLNLAKSAIQRLEKEKRTLLTRLSETKSARNSTIEKHDAELSEKSSLVKHDYCDSPPPLSTKSLLERIEAQQRRIVALEFAEKGNEPLVSEYEKSLAEVISLKGQVIKLESALLEAQIKSPLQSSHDKNHPDLEYWKSYCEMLKEENMQLTLRVTSLESSPSPMPQQRVNDLEQTVLTLRGLVSKLQAEKSSNTGHRKPDSRPTSGRSSADKTRNASIDMYKIEISNLKRSIQDKDLLLEKSKEMLKIAAEREEDLLRENTMLRRRLEQLKEHKRELFSA